MKTEQVHIDTLQIGDTVQHEGRVVTLTQSNFKRDSFLGPRIYGDSYSLGTKPVHLVTDLNDEEE